MGRAFIANSQTDITITRSIMRETVKGLMQRTGFPERADIIFDDDTVDGPRQLKNYFDGCYGESGVRTNYRSYVFVEYTDNLSEMGWINSRRVHPVHAPIYDDSSNGVVLTPEYREHEVNMSIRFRCNDKVKLSSWINMLKSTDSVKTHLGYIDIRYDYAIPDAFLDFINTSYEMQQLLPGEKETLKEHLHKRFKQGVIKRSNLDGKHVTIAVNEVQENVEGYPEDKQFYNTKQIQRGIYEVTLDYKFFYQKIIGTVLTYPALIHNQFIPEKYLSIFSDQFRLRNDADAVKPLTFLDGKLNDYEIDYYYKGDGGSRMVPWDDWFPSTPVEDTQTVNIIPICVSDTDYSDVYNLRDLGEEYLPKAIVDYAESCWSVIGDNKACLLSVTVFSVGDEETLIPGVVDKNLNVRTIEPMDPKKRNYVRIALNRSPTLLHPDRLAAFLENAEVALGILKLYDADLQATDSAPVYNRVMPASVEPGRHKYLPSLLLTDGTKIIPKSFAIWVKQQESTPDWFVSLNPGLSKTVGTYNITTGRN